MIPVSTPANRRRSFCFSLLLLLSFAAQGQETDTLIKKLDSLSKKTDSAGGQVNKTNPEAYNDRTTMTRKTYFVLLASDLKQMFTKPFHMKGRDWKYLGMFAATEVALSFADKPIQRGALRLRRNEPWVSDVSQHVTDFGGLYELYTIGALGAYSFVFKKQKMKTATLLASQAYITGAALQTVVKFFTGRERPYTVNPDSVEANPKFHGPGYRGVRDAKGNRLGTSFPSGHATVAFAAATVFAMEYRDRPLIPIVAYSAASLIGLSRITENKHWATDVLAGAVLGYLTGRQVVNNYHRYARIRAPERRKRRGHVSFDMRYQFGTVQPAMVYHFRE